MPNQSMKPTAPMTAVHSMHVYEIRPRRDRGGVDLISDALPFNDVVDDKSELQQ